MDRRGETAEDGPERAATTTTSIAWETKKKIVEYNPSWPLCEYSALSKRLNKSRHRRVDAKAVARTVASISGWWKLKSVSIDGMSGCGKSTLAMSMNREYMKINRHCPDITYGPGYNYSPLRSLEYIMYHVLYDTKDAYVVWDRCRYSNLVFAYVHHLMSVYRDRSVPGPDDDEPFLYINNMALATGLFVTVSYCEHLCADKRHILFIVNRDLNLVMQSLFERGGANDVYNAKEYNYQMAQYHVYRYFARLLDAPLIDLDVLFRHCAMTLDDVHAELKSRIDIPERLDQIELPRPPSRTESIALHTFCDRNEDSMVYVHSNK